MTQTPARAEPVPLPTPTVGSLAQDAAASTRYVLDVPGGCTLWVFDLGLACCAVEFVASTLARPDVLRPASATPASEPPHAAAVRVDVMVVSGTVTDKMAPLVKRIYDQMPEPKYVVSFGSCANSGGPYWDSYCVTKGVDQIVPVDVYVPGCPPRPESLLQGIAKLRERIASAS
jgi:NADH-quinone oxidoreductase subunit B